MARKKPAPKKKSVIKKKKPTLKKKPAVRKKSSTKKRPLAKKKPAAKKKAVRGKSRARGRTGRSNPLVDMGHRGLGAASAGQSGDTQGLSRRQYSDSESVEELLEEGQYLEAEAVSGVENARDPDESEVRTSEVPEDDVPEEYTDRD